MLLKVVITYYLFFFVSCSYFLATSQFLPSDAIATEADSVGLAEIVSELKVPTITVLLLHRRLKSVYGEFLSLINNNLQQSITFDDREKFLLWVEESQTLGYSTTTLVFGRPKDLIEEVLIEILIILFMNLIVCIP